MGSPTDPNGRLRVTSKITSIGTNQYRLDISLDVKSSETWNDYGINCYAHIGNQQKLLGTFKIPQNTGVCVPNNYSTTFTVSSNTSVYASCVCTHCNGSQDGWTGRSNADTATYTNPVKPNSPPPKPTISCLNHKASNKYFLERTLDVELSAVSDPDGDPVRYVIYAQYKAPNSDTWVTAGDNNSCILYDTSKRRVSIDVTKYSRGTQFRVWGKAEDAHPNHGGANSGETSKIDNIYRKLGPSTPTISCTNTQVNNKYIVENSLTLKLSNSTDKDNIGCTMSYCICGEYKTPNSSQWLSMAGSDNIISNTQNVTLQIDKYERGTQFKVWGYAIDNQGARSTNSTQLINIFRNRKPNKISSISPNSKIIIGNSIDISWSFPGDPDGQSLKYSVWIKVDTQDYYLLTTDISATNFNVDLSSYSPGTEFRFKVVPNDGMVNGDETISPNYKKDFPPSFLLPINNSTLYQTNPRIVAKMIKGSGVHLHVLHDNESFNSNNNSDRFRKDIKTLSDGVSMCFNPTLSAGKKTSITIYSTHNGFESSRVSLVITINTLTLDLSSSIKKSINESLISGINKIRQAYRLQNISVPNITIGETIVSKSHITEMTNSLDAVRNTINEYDSNKINSNWNNNSDNIIRRIDFQQILEGISNV